MKMIRGGAILLLAACGGDAKPAERTEVHGSLRLSEPRAIVAPAAPGSSQPNLAAAPDGRVYLSWTEPRPDSAHALRFSVLEGGRWSEPRTAAEGRGWLVNWADFPSLVVMADGRMAAHWLHRLPAGGHAYEVRLSRSADGGRTWGPAIVPHRDGTSAEHGFVSLYPAGGDSLGVIWLDGRKYAGRGDDDPAGETAVMATTMAADGGMPAESPLDGRACDCCQTSVAVTAGGPLLVYRDRTADEIRDIHTVRRVNGRWTEPRPVHPDGWRIEACPVNGPSVAADGRRVAVAWFTAARDTPRVLVAFSEDEGASWSAPVRVDDGTPAGHVSVQLMGDGALVSWIERGAGGKSELRVRAMGGAGARGEARMLAAVPERSVPRMARDSGGVVFAWSEPGRVYTARMEIARR
ncbi:MAG TPA: sialidase family protein [Longimicrobium sp.]|nr:sialidase family protein [Longimicrobium sp.]